MYKIVFAVQLKQGSKNGKVKHKNYFSKKDDGTRTKLNV